MVLLYVHKKMNQTVSKFKSDDLIKSGSIFLIGSVLVGVFNYLYHILMGRMLGPVQYGVLGSLFAIVYLVSFAGNTFSMVTSKYSAEFKGKKQDSAINYLVKQGLFKLSIYCLIVFVVYLFFIPSIARFMNLQNYSGLFIVGIVGYLSVLSALVTGALNGLQKFVWQNSLSFISTFLKLFFAILLVYFGLGVNGALAAIALGTAVILGAGFIPLRNELKQKVKEKIQTREIYLYAIPVLIASLLPLMAITFDQMLVKHFFSSDYAGHYAAAGTIAKIIWFGSGFFVSALFPKVVNYRAQKKDTSGLLTRGLIYTSFFALLGSGVLLATPRLIVSVMFGSDYIDIAQFVGLFGLALGLFSINQVMITYNLAVERYGFLGIVFAGILLEIIGIFVFHSTLNDVIKIVLLTQVFITAGLLIYNRKELYGRNKK